MSRTITSRRRSRKQNTRRMNSRRIMITEDSELDLSSLNPDKGLRLGFKYPQPFRAVPVQNSKIRFNVLSNIVTLTIAAQDFLKLHCFATAASTGYGLARAIKLKAIELWVPFQTAAVDNSLGGIVFYGTGATNTGTNDERFAVGASYDKPAHLLAKPPGGTLVGYWQNYQSSLTMFDLRNIPQGSTIDFDFDWISGENQTAVNVGPFAITAGSSVGEVGVHPPSTSLSAIGLNNL